MIWQPIETAPKDGTPVLVFCPEFPAEHSRNVAPRVMEARWNNPGMDPRNGAWGDPVYDEWNCEPTHWMPLPAPPAKEQP